MCPFDLLIKDAMIIDGSGQDRYCADVGIIKGRIDAIGKLNGALSEKTLHASGRILSPGFIDAHDHSDFYVFNDPSLEFKLQQGVTTAICGNCGNSCAPVSHRYFDIIKGYYGNLLVGMEPPFEWENLTSMERLFDAIDALKPSINIGFHIAHGIVRMSVMGMDNRSATPEELHMMCEIVREGMRNGAIGISTGLIYPPGVYATEDELVTLARVAGEYGGRYVSHIRNESHLVSSAVEEAISIGRRAAVPVIISHLKVGGKAQWGTAYQILHQIDEANREGLDVSMDQYPYRSGSTLLSASLPPSFHVGGVTETLKRLSNPGYRMQLEKLINAPDADWDNMLQSCGGYSGVLILSAPEIPKAEGLTLYEYAHGLGVSPLDAMIDILIKTRCGAIAAYFFMDESDIKTIMRHPMTMIGSDGIMIGKNTKVHPRATSTFPRILSEYVRKSKLLTLEEAIHKMTGLPAAKLGLSKKGHITTGCDADLVLFDASTIQAHGHYLDPYAPVTGLECVIVNGHITCLDGIYQGTREGKVIRR